jgi:hypothetical protein
MTSLQIANCERKVLDKLDKNIRQPARPEYFYAPGVYLTGIDMRRSYFSGSWSVR